MVVIERGGEEVNEFCLESSIRDNAYFIALKMPLSVAGVKGASIGFNGRHGNRPPRATLLWETINKIMLECPI